MRERNAPMAGAQRLQRLVVCFVSRCSLLVVADVVFPENRKLPILDQAPNFGNIKPQKVSRRLTDMQGPELVHNTLMYNQYGVIVSCQAPSSAAVMYIIFCLQALSGGQLKPGHINMIRQTINKGLDPNRMFAIWRIDAPWKPVTKRVSESVNRTAIN